MKAKLEMVRHKSYLIFPDKKYKTDEITFKDYIMKYIPSFRNAKINTDSFVYSKDYTPVVFTNVKKKKIQVPTTKQTFINTKKFGFTYDHYMLSNQTITNFEHLFYNGKTMRAEKKSINYTLCMSSNFTMTG